jgi:hypothetical protein
MKWKPFETAPMDDTDVLIWDGERVSVAYYDPNADVWIGLYCEEMNGPTWESFDYWMPLPEGPK